MKNIAVLGGSHGDEGKGRIVHEFSTNYDWICRISGGSNAGHTIYRDGVKYVHNLLPSFDWRSERPKAFLGSGMVIDVEQLHLEIEKLHTINTSYPSRVYVDPDAFLVLPGHKKEDQANNGHIGTTNRGIGPAYVDKMSRNGLRIRDIQNNNFYTKYSVLISNLIQMGIQFKTVLELQPEMEKSSILFEGAQGIMLDINHGVYPYVSCGDATVSGIYSSGFAFAKLDRVYGVVKCYTTKVGAGPFPTELNEQEAEALRQKGGEFGATTGRPRRIGWLDLPALDYACKKGGITDLIMTKFDILNGMNEVPVCVAYDNPITSSADFFNAKPQYVKMDGWQNASQINQLSSFINLVEKTVSKKIKYISYGVNPEDFIELNN